MDEMGRGTAYRYEVLELTEDMTVGDLIRKLSAFPPAAKLDCLFKAVREGNKFATESVDKSKMRVPVEVSRGRMNLENT
jgi:hypothetical protein